MNELLGSFENVLLLADRSEIEAGDVNDFAEFFDRLEISNALTKQLEGRIGFMVNGYEKDPREIWEIPEVRTWMVAVQRRVKHWFYFLNRERSPRSLVTVLAFCWSQPKRLGDGSWECPGTELESWLSLHVDSFYELAERLRLSEAEAGRIVTEAIRCVYPEFELP